MTHCGSVALLLAPKRPSKGPPVSPYVVHQINQWLPWAAVIAIYILWMPR